ATVEGPGHRYGLGLVNLNARVRDPPVGLRLCPGALAMDLRSEALRYRRSLAARRSLPPQPFLSTHPPLLVGQSSRSCGRAHHLRRRRGGRGTVSRLTAERRLPGWVAALRSPRTTFYFLIFARNGGGWCRNTAVCGRRKCTDGTRVRERDTSMAGWCPRAWSAPRPMPRQSKKL